MLNRWEVGVLEVLVRPDVLPLLIGGWLGLLAGAGAQFLLLKKCTGIGRWVIVLLVPAAAIVSEACLRLLGGWDGVLFAVVLRLLWYPLIGAGLGWLLWRKNRAEQRRERNEKLVSDNRQKFHGGPG